MGRKTRAAARRKSLSNTPSLATSCSDWFVNEPLPFRFVKTASLHRTMGEALYQPVMNAQPGRQARRITELSSVFSRFSRTAAVARAQRGALARVTCIDSARARRRAGISWRPITCTAASSATASRGMRQTTQVASSFAMVGDPASRISFHPAAPSLPVPVRMTPISFRPACCATERNRTHRHWARGGSRAVRHPTCRHGGRRLEPTADAGFNTRGVKIDAEWRGSLGRTYIVRGRQRRRPVSAIS
jgi:hypothetical protein